MARFCWAVTCSTKALCRIGGRSTCKRGGSAAKRVMPGLRVSVRLYGADGNYYAQVDQPPVTASFGQEHWQIGSPILSQFTLTRAARNAVRPGRSPGDFV